MGKRATVKAIILAGGSAKRMNLSLPKQLAIIGKRPLVSLTLDVFERCKAIDSIVLVAYRKYIRPFRRLLKQYRYHKVEQLCWGGKTRQQSVFNALKKIRDCDYVIIHDGVRPFVTEEVILKVIKAVKKFKAVTCAVKATDTIVKAKGPFLGGLLSRSELWHLQTPQAFKFALIFKAHKIAQAKKIFAASDDAQLLLGLKKKVKLIAGSYKNIKITTNSDLLLAKHVIARSPDKVGTTKQSQHEIASPLRGSQ